jgi:hypothetical protein
LADEVIGKAPKQERKYVLIRNVEGPQGRKMRCIDNYSRDEEELERKSVGT